MDYPKGAIKSISELMSYKGKKIYSYSREHAWANSIFVFKGMVQDENDRIVPYKEGMNFRFFQAGNELHSIRDKNIIRNTYNDWFLFGSEEDAKAYLDADIS